MNDTPKTDTTKKGNAPTHRVYFVKGEGDNSTWLELGAAWENSDGKGFNISLDVVPIGGFNGKLTMRKIEPKG